MRTFDSLKGKLKKSEEIEAVGRTKDAITTSSEKTKLETKGRDTEINKKEWTIGDKIENRYEIYNIMPGGMRIIYVCYDYEFKELVALKTFQDRYLKSKFGMKSFRIEAEIRLKLGEHENIVSTKFVDFIEGKPYIVLEYIAEDEKYGADLSGWIARGGLNLTLALDFAIQFCNGMDYAHTKFKGMGKSFVHRNVKPSNILITQDRVVKVAGFGLAKIFDEMSDAICGTPSYMSPEQFSGSKDIDVRSDIYSFGCVLYEMLTGKLPFVGISLGELRDKHLKERQKNPKVVNPLIPSALDSVVMKCLEKKPENRYQSFREVKEELIKFKEVLQKDKMQTMNERRG
ncbi:serine/threonine protein kinase [candidate division WOR-3 bacterium]|nr:serine/threonine protein kinase [candidate division WOR-3 bacterium]